MNVLGVKTPVVILPSVLIHWAALNVIAYLVTRVMAESVEVSWYVLIFVTEESIQYINSTEIDECASDTDNCDINADCINTGGSFECVCRTGYEGNGQVCTGILL